MRLTITQAAITVALTLAAFGAIRPLCAALCAFVALIERGWVVI